MSEGSSNAVIFHAAVESVVVGALAFWLARRLSLAEERIFLLEERLKQLAASDGAEIQNVLKRHEVLLQRLINAQAAAPGSAPRAPPARLRRPAPAQRPKKRKAPQSGAFGSGAGPAPFGADDDVARYVQTEIEEINRNRAEQAAH